MKAAVSKEFKKIFLLTFTKELIRHSGKINIEQLQKIIELKEQDKRKEGIPRMEIISPRETGLKEVGKPGVWVKKPRSIEIPSGKLPIKGFTKPTPRSLFIPEPKLPEHLEYLKPTPAAPVEIDLVKINPLIKDPAVKIIEANPEERVIVVGTMGTKPTDIILSKEDIDRIINKFSEFSKIPVIGDIYRVVAGNLILSAVISETIGSRFTIKKMAISPPQINKPHLQLPKLPFQT